MNMMLTHHSEQYTENDMLHNVFVPKVQTFLIRISGNTLTNHGVVPINNSILFMFWCFQN